MATPMPADKPEDLSWLLKGLLQRVPRTRSGLLLSSDGIVKAAEELTDEDAKHLASIAAGQHSLARGLQRRFHTGELRQIVVELEAACLFVGSAGEGACLAVLADPGIDGTVLGYEMAMLVKAVGGHLRTAPRSTPEGTPA